MPRLLVVTTIPETMGAFLLPYVQYFRQKGWFVDGMAQGLSDFTSLKENFNQTWDIEWSRNPLNPQNFLKAAPAVRAVVEREKYDLVHVHTPVAAFVTRFALRRFRTEKKINIIYTAHGFHFYAGGHPLKNLAFLTMEKLAGRWTDYLVTINREDESAAKHHRLVPSERVWYMPGIGIDLDLYRPQQVGVQDIHAVRQSLGLEQKNTLFLAIAELTPRKRPQDILQAFAKLQHPTVHLAYAGGGPLLPSLRQLAENLQVSDRVHFLGFRPDISTLICAAEATVLVSRQEGFPRSVMESLALEVPVIGTKIRGTQDLLQNGVGRLVNVGDIDAIAEAMTWILNHRAEAKAMGRQGRKEMTKYSLANTLILHESIYARALAES